MAQSPTERVTALERIVDTHTIRLDALVKDVDALYEAHSEAAKDFTDLKREFALLKREVEELRKWQDDMKKGKEEWGRKLWMIVPPLLAVLVSTALALVITLYVKK
jgi:cell shape-determining protein MreC